jgi:ABC-type multidrug transport system ATPase subunit
VASMQIKLNNAGKRYNRDWIFRNVNYVFSTGNKYAITGSNGSGKSTLLQVIAGSIIFNEGNIEYKNNDTLITEEEIYNYIAIATPYLELIEEMTTGEMLDFHSQFKPLTKDPKEIIELIGLEKATNKQIRYFSSGMKQRLKLALAFFSDSSILLLDEPTTNLDSEGIQLYLKLISSYTGNKLVIISSNDKHEYDFCEEVISIADFK